MYVAEAAIFVSGSSLPAMTYLLPGLGNSLGPLGTRTFSLSVLRLFWFNKLGRCSNVAGRVAEAGREGLRKVAVVLLVFDASESAVVVRWNLRREG